MSNINIQHEAECFVRYNKHGIQEAIQRAKKAAVDFASIEDNDGLAVWKLDCLAQDLHCINELVKQYAAKVEAFEVIVHASKEA